MKYTKKLIAEKEQELKYNKKRLFRRAWYLLNCDYSIHATFSEALKQSWLEQRLWRNEIREELSYLYAELEQSKKPVFKRKYESGGCYKNKSKGYMNATYTGD